VITTNNFHMQFRSSPPLTGLWGHIMFTLRAGHGFCSTHVFRILLLLCLTKKFCR